MITGRKCRNTLNIEAGRSQAQEFRLSAQCNIASLPSTFPLRDSACQVLAIHGILRPAQTCMATAPICPDQFLAL